ncbi:MAG: alpha-1,4-glucan--maltose-1-phosphate maltosyltransferase [Acetobacteraceae bacterium]|nr:alpha-1,4-glucan--maltose-1-phosphate maltosyltransferase [Acetobacteraceae bacterium]
MTPERSTTEPGKLLGQVAQAGFDTVLCHELQPGVADAARRAGLELLVDLDPLHAGADAPPNLFAALPLPTLDPRGGTELSTRRHAVITGDASATALGEYWAGEYAAQSSIGGVRLLGLRDLPPAYLPAFLSGFRRAAPDTLLFGWTPGLSWEILASLEPGSFDYVALSLPWWNGRQEWLWRELDLLRRIGTVVADAGEHAPPAHHKLAALIADGWMSHDADAADLVALRAQARSRCPYARLISPPGEPVIALQLTDQPDPRRASQCVVAVTNLSDAPATLAPANLLTRLGGNFARFTDIDNASNELLPTGRLRVDAGAVVTFAAKAIPLPPARPIVKASASEATKLPRIAIEAPSPAVDGGRFPARRTVGSVVTVECDLICDGHDRLAAALKYRGPGQTGWTEVPMHLVVNDRWSAELPLNELGLTHYTIEAWKDVWAYYVFELSAKHAAGVNTSLEIKEGVALVEAAIGRTKSRKLSSALRAVLKGRKDDDALRDALLRPETAALMHAADDRPFRVELERAIPIQAERTAAGFASWYEVFPRSMSDDPTRHGTFRDVIRHLPRIKRMGFDVLYFPPIHPIGTKNRKGPNNTLTPGPDDVGSPYAIGSPDGGHTAIHPELGSLEDFEHLRMAAAQSGIELALDFAIQCSPDHPWLEQHPDWFNWRPDGSIRYAENPPKKYEDIVNVDFYAPGAMPSLWIELCEAVLFWARQGVRLFRVDNPHTKAFPFWEWMIAEVQQRYPDTVFLAEAFTRPKVMYRLAKIGFSQSYTYFTWRNTKPEFEQYLTELTRGPAAEFFRPHFFVNTPDINPVMLHTAGRPGYLIRAALAATLSGLWGVYNGFELCEGTPLVEGKEEYLDSEKYALRAWDWDRPGNIVAEIAQLNAIRRANPALQTHLGITFLNAPNGQILAFEKATPDRSNVVLVVINLDHRNTQSGTVDVPFWRYAPEPGALLGADLLAGSEDRWTDRTRFVTLPPDRPYGIWRLSPTV